MGTRAGDIDPAIPLHLMRTLGHTAAEMDSILNKKSGLLGLCGDNDLRAVIERRAKGDPEVGGWAGWAEWVDWVDWVGRVGGPGGWVDWVGRVGGSSEWVEWVGRVRGPSGWVEASMAVGFGAERWRGP